MSVTQTSRASRGGANSSTRVPRARAIIKNASQVEHSPAQLLLAFFVVALMAGPFVFITTGNATADSSGIPTFSGTIVDNNQALEFTGYYSWGGVYTPVSNGSQVFASQFILVVYSIVPGNLVIPISVVELGQTSNITTTAYQAQADIITINLANNVNWNTVVLDIGGTNLTYSVSTPISLLPPSVANVGGLDVLVLAVISEMIIAFASIVAFNRWLMKKAQWAPKFSLYIWGHVILIGIIAAIIVDYHWVDQTFAGWSPLLYVIAVCPMLWAYSLSLFNKADRGLLFRVNAPLAGKLSFTGWDLQYGKNLKGDYTLIQPGWAGFWARVFNHFVRLGAAEAGVTQPEPFIADVETREFYDRRELLRKAGRVRRPSPSKGNPLDDFEMRLATLDGRPAKRSETRATKILFTPLGQPVDVKWPRLTVHRTIIEPAERNEEGTVILPAHEKVVWSWPHYTVGESTLKLHPIHFRSAMSVTAGWRSVEDLAQILSDTLLDLEALKAGFDTKVEQEVEEKLLARQTLLSRIDRDLDPTEAAQEAERPRDILPSLDVLTDSSGMVSRELASKPPEIKKPGARR